MFETIIEKIDYNITPSLILPPEAGGKTISLKRVCKFSLEGNADRQRVFLLEFVFH